MPYESPREDLPSMRTNNRAMRFPNPVMRNPSAIKNAATIIQIESLPKPLSASSLAFMVPVIIAAPRPISATDGVGSGWKIRPRIVPAKIASICIPRGSTPGGTGINQMAIVTVRITATLTMRAVLACLGFSGGCDCSLRAVASGSDVEDDWLMSVLL